MSETQRMPPCTKRKLTPGEVELAGRVFGAGLDARKVHILALPVWNRAFVAGSRLIAWPAGSAVCDFSVASLNQRSVFVHELTHVWQAQSGVNLILAKLRAGDGRKAYAYDLSTPCEFGGLNIEQQAMIVQHAYLAAHGAETPFESSAYSGVLVALPGSILSNPHQV